MKSKCNRQIIALKESPRRMMNIEYYGTGNELFEFIKQKQHKEFLKNAHWAISQCGLWDWLRRYEPSEDRGFMFSDSDNVKLIYAKMHEQCIAGMHSGSSLGIVMRYMEHIAKNGFEYFKQNYAQ